MCYWPWDQGHSKPPWSRLLVSTQINKLEEAWRGFCVGCTNLSLPADQYDQTDFRIRTQKTGEKAVSSRELTITYIYNAFYW